VATQIGVITNSSRSIHTMDVQSNGQVFGVRITGTVSQEVRIHRVTVDLYLPDVGADFQ
jgi:hypothetical protein